MKCPFCKSENGAYGEIVDFNPGCEDEWTMCYWWDCFVCLTRTNSYEDGFEESDEE